MQSLNFVEEFACKINLISLKNGASEPDFDPGKESKGE